MSSEVNGSTSGFVNVPTEKQGVSVFYGIKKGARIPDGYFRDMNNMSSDEYPCLSTRHSRIHMKGINIATLPGEPVCTAEYDDGVLFALSNGKLCYNYASFSILGEISAMTKMGKQIFVMPEGALVKDDLSECEKAGINEKGSFKISFSDSSFNDIEVDMSAEKPEAGEYWYDRENKGLYKYSDVQKTWAAVPVIYTKLQSDTFDFSRIHEEDAIRITTEKDIIDTFVCAVFSDNIVVEGVICDDIGTDEISLGIERRFPEMQYICCHNNRIWGCNYNGTFNEIYASKLGDPLNWYCYRGLSTDSYAVSLGEAGEFTGCSEVGDSVVFFKENCIYTIYGTEPSDFQTVKTDCFGVQKGSEKSICRINGQVYYKSCHGIMRLSEGGLPVLISEDLGKDIWSDAVAGTDGRKYYIVMSDLSGNRSMYVYDTLLDLWHKEDVPCENVFSFVTYKNNLMCFGKKATDIEAFPPVKKGPKTGEAPKQSDYNSIVEYMAAYTIWAANAVIASTISGLTEERARQVAAEKLEIETSELTDEQFIEFLNDYVEFEETYEHTVQSVYLDSEAQCNEFLPVNGTDTMKDEEKRFHYYAETGLMGLEDSGYKRIRNIEIRMKLNPGARLSIGIQYDDTGLWEDLNSYSEDMTGTFRFNHRLQKCDSFRLRFYGYGKVLIYGITFTYEEAGSCGI